MLTGFLRILSKAVQVHSALFTWSKMYMSVRRSLVFNWVCSFTSERTKAAVVGEEFSGKGRFQRLSRLHLPRSKPCCLQVTQVYLHKPAP